CVRALTSLWHQDAGVRAEFWDRAQGEYRAAVERAFAGYTAWRARWLREHPVPARFGLRAGALPGDFAIAVERDGFSVGVVGLNSAFLQLADGDFRGRLDL